MAKMDDRQGKATKAPHACDPERTAKSDRRKLERVTLQSTAAGDELLYFDSRPCNSQGTRMNAGFLG